MNHGNNEAGNMEMEGDKKAEEGGKKEKNAGLVPIAKLDHTTLIVITTNSCQVIVFTASVLPFI